MPLEIAAKPRRAGRRGRWLNLRRRPDTMAEIAAEKQGPGDL
jgi:hypothetical protein